MLLVADEQGDDESREDGRHIQRDQRQDGVVADLGREELLGAGAGGVEVGVLAARSQPVDVLVDVIVRGIALSAAVCPEERLSAVAAHDDRARDRCWSGVGGDGRTSELDGGGCGSVCITPDQGRQVYILLGRSCCASYL